MASWGVALCPSCKDVLVATLAWRGKEFVCLSCGSLWEYLEPVAGDETPERLARMEEAKAEWIQLSDGLISGGAMLEFCRIAGGACSREPHIAHATPDEFAAHEAAQARIGERLRLVPA